jgi:hypothetical protein
LPDFKNVARGGIVKHEGLLRQFPVDINDVEKELNH